MKFIPRPSCKKSGGRSRSFIQPPSPHLGSLHFENGGPIQKDLVTLVDGRESVEIDHGRHNRYGVINAYDVALVRESVNARL